MIEQGPGGLELELGGLLGAQGGGGHEAPLAIRVVVEGSEDQIRLRDERGIRVQPPLAIEGLGLDADQDLQVGEAEPVALDLLTKALEPADPAPHVLGERHGPQALARSGLEHLQDRRAAVGEGGVKVEIGPEEAVFEATSGHDQATREAGQSRSFKHRLLLVRNWQKPLPVLTDPTKASFGQNDQNISIASALGVTKVRN
ncbi:hypothetical protein D3C87_1511020 [compost metagenome]